MSKINNIYEKVCLFILNNMFQWGPYSNIFIFAFVIAGIVLIVLFKMIYL